MEEDLKSAPIRNSHSSSNGYQYLNRRISIGKIIPACGNSVKDSRPNGTGNQNPFSFLGRLPAIPMSELWWLLGWVLIGFGGFAIGYDWGRTKERWRREDEESRKRWAQFLHNGKEDT